MTSPAPIEAAITGMHAQFPEFYVHKRDHEVTITCDMLQFWLRNEPLGDRHYEFTLSFLNKDVQHWAKLATGQRVEHFNIEFHPASLWREMTAVLTNQEYLAAHTPDGLKQLVGDLENMLGMAKAALANRAA